MIQTLEEVVKRHFERKHPLKRAMQISHGDRRFASHILVSEGVQTRVSRARKAFRLLPLDQLRGLPKGTERSKRSAIYFLWKGPILDYIGQSMNIGSRLASHRTTGRKFTHCTILLTPRECLREIEKQYIYYYLPPGNEAL